MKCKIWRKNAALENYSISSIIPMWLQKYEAMRMKVYNENMEYKQWESITRKTVRWKIRICVQILFVATLCVERLWITHLAIRMTDVAQIQPEHLVPVTNEKNENEPTVA